MKSYMRLSPESRASIPESVQMSIDIEKEKINNYRASQLQRLTRDKFRRNTVKRDGRKQTTNVIRKNIYEHIKRLCQTFVRSSHDPTLEASSLFRDYYIQLLASNEYGPNGFVKLRKFKDESKIKMVVNNLSPRLIDLIIEKKIEEGPEPVEDVSSLVINKKRKMVLNYYIKPERDNNYGLFFRELFEILNRYFDTKGIKETNWRYKIKFLIDNLERQLLLRIWNIGLEYKNYYPEYIYDDIHSIYETPGDPSVVLENRGGKTRRRRTRRRK